MKYCLTSLIFLLTIAKAAYGFELVYNIPLIIIQEVDSITHIRFVIETPDHDAEVVLKSKDGEGYFSVKNLSTWINITVITIPGDLEVVTFFETTYLPEIQTWPLKNFKERLEGLISSDKDINSSLDRLKQKVQALVDFDNLGEVHEAVFIQALKDIDLEINLLMSYSPEAFSSVKDDWVAVYLGFIIETKNPDSSNDVERDNNPA